MIENLRTTIGENGYLGCAAIAALAVLLLPLYLAFAVWDYLMQPTRTRFDEMLDEELSRVPRGPEPSLRTG